MFVEILEKVDRVLKSYDYEDMFKKLNSIEDEEKFFETLSTMDEKEKMELEEAVIGITDEFDFDEDVNSFYKKYHEYALKSAKENILEYLNNNYLRFLFCKEMVNMNKIKDYDNEVNGKSVWDIYYDLLEAYNNLIENKFTSKELTLEEHKFIKRFFLFIVFYDRVYKKHDGKKDLMYDIVDYFDKYPIKNYDNLEDRQLYILYILSKQLIIVDIDSIVTFDRFYNEDNISSGGYFLKLSDGRCLINISNLNMNNEKEMYENIFTVFHELGHLMQRVNNDKYPVGIQELFEKEQYIICNDRDFYKSFHDSFCIERDADWYALSQILEIYKNDKPENILHLIDKEKKKKRIEFFKMYGIRLKRYQQLIDKEEKGKTH